MCLLVVFVGRLFVVVIMMYMFFLGIELYLSGVVIKVSDFVIEYG